MPRTKAPRKVKKEQSDQMSQVLAELEDQESTAIHNLTTIFEERKFMIEKFFLDEEKKLKSNLNKTHLSTISISNTTSVLGTSKRLNVTRKTRSKVDDEGYLTAESRSLSSDRKSRSRLKQRTTRVSRSLSRSQLSTVRKSTRANPYKTPLGKKPPEIQVITPKVQLNTPQVLLRRPRQGEMAVSLQGSPLMVGPVLSEEGCSVSIPLPNGQGVFAIQPLRGLRVSQIPDFDATIKQQLETLKDNLEKFCSSKK